MRIKSRDKSKGRRRIKSSHQTPKSIVLFYYYFYVRGILGIILKENGKNWRCREDVYTTLIKGKRLLFDNIVRAGAVLMFTINSGNTTVKKEKEKKQWHYVLEDKIYAVHRILKPNAIGWVVE
ncbi:hypothetical protein HYC85_013248 [Camellia sinensis]|uniref:Uncharacterized protein n=1 Tax=Camellia sinensis TaxID=4442 RepID=A0A7J7H501_CAMSI|nr:hypothetical protein HYC85_013248 [Camellia sinensis]